MTDEQRVRALLTTATELPDDILPPVQRLVGLGRRSTKVRSRIRVATVGAVAAVAVAAPWIIGLSGRDRPAPAVGHQVSGPSVAEIAGYHWSALAPSPLGARSNPVVALAGHELIELSHSRPGGVTHGAAFDPVTGRWHEIPSLAANAGFDYAVTAWTGHQLFFVGLNATCGRPFSICLRRAGLYDPATKHWTMTVLPRPMDTLFRLAATWNGRDIILAAADSASARLGIASLDPVTGHWQMITPALPVRHPPRFVATVATPDRTILWSLWARERYTARGRVLTRGVDVLALSADGTWQNVTDHWPQKRTVESPIFTGRKILVSPGQLFCGIACSPQFAVLNGYFADPVTLGRTLIPTGPLAESEPPYIWTGRAVIAMNLAANIPPPHPLPLDAMAIYNVVTNGWTRLPAPPGHPWLAAIPVWTGSQLLALTNSGQLLAFHR